MKFCKKCRRETERYADGRCKPCANAYAAVHYAANRESIVTKSKAYQAANRESKAAYDAAYRAVNRDSITATKAVYAEANPEAVRIKSANRRARKIEAGGTLSKGLSAKLFKLQRGLCPCCNQPLGDDYHLDHIMPLKLGGTNTDDNIQLLRATCNLQKNAKHPVDFMQQRGKLL